MMKIPDRKSLTSDWEADREARDPGACQDGPDLDAELLQDHHPREEPNDDGDDVAEGPGQGFRALLPLLLEPELLGIGALAIQGAGESEAASPR